MEPDKYMHVNTTTNQTPLEGTNHFQTVQQNSMLKENSISIVASNSSSERVEKTIREKYPSEYKGDDYQFDEEIVSNETDENSYYYYGTDMLYDDYKNLPEWKNSNISDDYPGKEKNVNNKSDFLSVQFSSKSTVPSDTIMKHTDIPELIEVIDNEGKPVHSIVLSSENATKEAEKDSSIEKKFTDLRHPRESKDKPSVLPEYYSDLIYDAESEYNDPVFDTDVLSEIESAEFYDLIIPDINPIISEGFEGFKPDSEEYKNKIEEIKSSIDMSEDYKADFDALVTGNDINLYDYPQDMPVADKETEQGSVNKLTEISKDLKSDNESLILAKDDTQSANNSGFSNESIYMNENFTTAQPSDEETTSSDANLYEIETGYIYEDLYEYYDQEDPVEKHFLDSTSKPHQNNFEGTDELH